MMKKFFVWALTLSVLCTAVGCGASQPASGNGTQTTTTTANGSSSITTTTENGQSTTTTTTTETGTSSSLESETTTTTTLPSSSVTTTTTKKPTTTTTKPTQPKKDANVRTQGAKGNGSTNDAAAFEKAIQAAGSNGKIYLPAGTYAIKSALTIPTNTTVVFERGAVLQVASGVTLTVNGKIEASEDTIFTGSGHLAGTPQSVGCPQWFGAVGNGSTDDTAAFQKTVDLFSKVRVPRRSRYAIKGTVTVSKPLEMYGEGTARVDLYITSTNTANAKAFVIKSSNVSFDNFKISGIQSTAATSSSTVFYVDCSAKNLSNITLSNIWAGWMGSFLKDSQTSGKSITNVTLKNLWINYCYHATGIHMTNFKSGIKIESVLVNQVLMQPADVSKPLWIIENCQGLDGKQLDVAGVYSSNTQRGDGGDGIVFKNCSNVKIERFMADYINGHCSKFINCTDFELVNWVCSLYELGAVYMENCQDFQFDVIKCNGIRSAASPVGDHGTALVMKNCKDNTITNLIFQDNVTHCMVVENSTDNVFKNVLFITNNGHCYLEQGTSDNNTMIGVTFTGNPGIAIQQVGANSKCIGIALGAEYYAQKVGPFTFD